MFRKIRKLILSSVKSTFNFKTKYLNNSELFIFMAFQLQLVHVLDLELKMNCSFQCNNLNYLNTI